MKTAIFEEYPARIAWVNGTGGDLAVNAVVVVGNLIGILLAATASAARGVLGIGGEHELAAVTAESWSFGDRLFWNATTSKLTAVENAAYTYAGRASKAKAAAATTACLLLNYGSGTVGDGATVSLTVVDGTDGTADLTCQIKDAAGNDLAILARLRVSVGGANDQGGDAITGITASTGSLSTAHTAAGDYDVLTDANGTAVLALDNNGAGTIYGWVELAGRIVATGAIVITA